MKIKRLLWDMGWVFCGLVAGFVAGVGLHEAIGELGPRFQIRGDMVNLRPLALVLGWTLMGVAAYRVQRYLRPVSLRESEIEPVDSFEDIT